MIADTNQMGATKRAELRGRISTMPGLHRFLRVTPKGNVPVFVAFNAVFDWMFVDAYFQRFLKRNPFGHSALDMKTLAMALLKKEYRESTKRNMPKSWFDPLPHTHVALDDAIEQGALFCNMLRAAGMVTDRD